MADPSQGGMLLRALDRACDIEPRETRATLASFLLVLVLMGSYYILRPVRDAMASDWTDAEVSWLWTFTFLFSAVAVSLYGGAVTRIRFQRLVPAVYGFFAASFLLFYLGTQTLAERTLLDKSFYVWISLFSLFHVSVFWSFMADTFSKPQATRLFGFIGAGASIFLLPDADDQPVVSNPNPGVPLPQIQRVDLSTAKSAFDEGRAVFVDVRSQAFYQDSHIPGALSIPLNQLEDRIGELNQDDWIILYCT